MIKFLLDIFYPPKCMFCGERLNNNEKYYCKKCYYKLSYREEPTCLICGRELIGPNNFKICNECYIHKRHVDANYPSFVYTGIIKEALLKFKFAGKMWYYKPFAQFIYDNIKDKVSGIDYIVYPPINRNTFYKRGFNQTEMISKELSKMLKIPYIKNCIYKTRQNEKQSLMSAEMRYKNVKGVYNVYSKYDSLIKGKNILFIDDIMTTGATIDECSKMLKKHGAISVCSATLCIAR